jgi:deazaflavin-dependent oxidoreductase (nitroreductase family)
MQSVVLLDTRGAKSGQLRQLATLCMPQGTDLILVGSNWGQQKHPAWVHNLRANPDAFIRYRGYVGPATAQEVDETQREDLWEKLVAFNPQYGLYQEGTSRILPLFRLSRPE